MSTTRTPAERRSKLFDDFATTPDEKKIAFIKEHREEILTIAEANALQPFEIILPMAYKLQKKSRRLQRDFFLENLVFIKDLRDIKKIWICFSDEKVYDVIDAWDRQANFAYNSVDDLDYIASCIKDEKFYDFYRRHKQQIIDLSKKEKVLDTIFVDSVIYAILRLFERVDDKKYIASIAGELLSEHVNAIQGLTDLNFIKTVFSAFGFPEVASTVCLAWQRYCDQQKPPTPIPYSEFEFLFKYILTDHDRARFIEGHTDAYNNYLAVRAERKMSEQMSPVLGLASQGGLFGTEKTAKKHKKHHHHEPEGDHKAHHKHHKHHKKK